MALRWGGEITVRTIAGLPAAGPVTTCGLPLVRAAVDVGCVATIGWCVTVAFLLPGLDGGGRHGTGQLPGPAGYRMLRRASWWAAGWAVAALLTLPFTLSDLLGQPVSQVTFDGVRGLAWSVNLGQSALAQAVLAAALWVGGLGALLMLRADPVLGIAVRGYSRLALGCWVAVSGLANAAVRLGSLDELWRSRYGAAPAGQVAALLVVGVFGAVHRRHAFGSFRRLAAGELLVFAATIGLAVALSRTPTPVPTDPVDTDAVTDLLGFAAPAPISAARLFWPPLLDGFFIAASVLAAGAYLIGVWRLYRAGHRWPVARTASWLGGVVLLGFFTAGGFARYAYVLFSAHMAQHMVLAMVVPVLLVGGAPATLALRTLRKPADPSVRGTRDWLLLALHSRILRALSHPVVALALYVVSLYVVSLYGLYFSDLLGVLMRYHLGHLAMLTHFRAHRVPVLLGPHRRRPRPATGAATDPHSRVLRRHGVPRVPRRRADAVADRHRRRLVHRRRPTWAGDLLADQRVGAGLACRAAETAARR